MSEIIFFICRKARRGGHFSQCSDVLLMLKKESNFSSRFRVEQTAEIV